jgi:peptide deformylase
MVVVSIENIPELARIIPTPLFEPMAVYKIAQQMMTICEAQNGIGLSAVQVGIPWQFFIVKFPHGYELFSDCVYVPAVPEKKTSVEGCLSLPGLRFVVERYPQVRVTGKRLASPTGDLVIENYDQEWQGLFSVVFQHEIDHQLGILISQIGKPLDVW